MDQQIPERNSMPHAFVLRNDCNTGTIHLIPKRIPFSNHFSAFIGDLQFLYHDIFRIIQQDCRRYIAMIYMRWRIQRIPIILIPDSLSAGFDTRRSSVPICPDHNRCILAAAVRHLQILSIKHTAAFKQNLIARLQSCMIDCKKTGKCALACQSIL